MNPNKDKTDFERPDRKTTAQGAPPHERVTGGPASDKSADDRAHGFSQDSGYPASGGSEAEARKQEEPWQGEICPTGAHDDRSGSTAPNINSATLQDIAKVDFVGTSFASAIVSLRERLGAFERWDQLRQIEGLKANKIAELQRAFRLGPTH